jgi:hypothetical protein
MSDEVPKRSKTAETDGVRKTKEHIAVRLEPEFAAKIDAVVQELSTEWHQAKRSDALRMLLAKGLRTYEAEKAARPEDGPAPAA